MDPTLAAQLLKTCAKSSATAFLDQNTSFTVDNEYYRQITLRKGILTIDQELTLDKSSAPIVTMGSAGEIRKNCGVFNQKANRKVVN
ncbi:hypothetical protein KY290_037328 [Solanum tuberosum]|uniref:peroxidase n=1 Tax=Solanum tuberosum TaxID=4113 RepID=A0ABQ7TWN6_SOLTU|nr:hypothetical protein KY285_036626 [Solanum tuberosum]KAH0738623.1 hypothetical protein KY290_037328 [Solanum tuberosum]